MAKAPSPLLGFNNNVRHKGRVFHIQTEDSGIRHPHIITHLFADGGRILKTTKTSYAEHVGRPAFAETVRKMMQEQHKAMFMALRNGQFDYLFEDNAGASGPPKEGTPSTPPPAPPPPAPPPVEVQAAPEPPPPAPAIAVPPPTPSASDGPPPSRRRGSRPTLDIDATAIHARETSASTPEVKMTAPVSRESAAPPSLDLDLEALERAAAAAQTPFVQQIENLPPPPVSAIGSAPMASTAAVSSFTASQPRPSAPRHTPTSLEAAAPPPPGTAPKASSISGRYAATRPASIFATKRPPEGGSIFGEDLISEKSLDEVILSYLAEDLEGPPDNK